jgi:hypothetical protein
VRGAGATSRTTGAGQGFIHDPADRVQAAAALGAAAKAAMHVSSTARRGFIDRGAHFVVAQNVAGADNHGVPGLGGSRPQNDRFANGSIALSQKDSFFKMVLIY